MFGKRPIVFPVGYWVLIFLGIHLLILFLFAFRLPGGSQSQQGAWEWQFAAMSVLLFVTTMAIFSFTVTQRVTALIAAINHFAHGDWEARASLQGADEVAQIGAAFDAMADTLATRAKQQARLEAALQENTIRLQSVVETLDVVVWSISADRTHYHYLSPSVEQIYGRPLMDFIANPRLWFEVIHPEDQQIVLAGQPENTLTSRYLEYRIIRPNGEIRWLNDRSFKTSDANGAVLRLDGVLVDITESKRSQEALAERVRLATLRADIGLFLTQGNDLHSILQQCAEAMVRHLDVAFFRIWTHNAAEQMLELQASAGLYTHLDGAHKRIPVGQFKIGRIAQAAQPHLTNNVLEDSEIGDREWAHREGMIAFAGYPLLVEGRVVGVMATFARHPLSQAVIDDLDSVAGGIAQLIERKHTEEALRISEERFRLALEGAREDVWDWNMVTDEVVYNPWWAALLGYDPSEIEPHASAWQRLLHPEDLPAANAAVHAHLEGRTPLYECEYRVRTKTGEWKWILDRGHVVARDAAGRPLRMTGTYKDISERKKAEVVLQNFFRLSLDLLCVTSSDGYFKRVNPAFEQSLGYTNAELLAEPFLHFVHSQDVESTLSHFNLVITGKDVVDFENRYRCKDGSYRWLSWRATAIDENGLIYAIARDITAQKRQNLLITQTHRAAHIGGWELDFVTNQLYWTEETYRIHETTPAEYIPTIETAIAFYAPESIPVVTTAVQQAIADGTPWDFELELITAKQRRIWVHAVGKVETENGKAVRAYGSFQDITERKRLAALMEQTHVAAHVGGWELDFITNQLYWTEETYHIHETTPADYKPTLETAVAFYAPESAPMIAAAVQQGIDAGTPWDLELELITAKQRRIWVHTVGKIQRDHGKPIKAYGSIQDVTTRKGTEAALRQSEVRNRAILDALPDLVFVCDKQGILLDAHRPDHDLYYVPMAQFLGKPVDQVLPPPTGAQIMHCVEHVAAGAHQIIEYPLALQGETRHFEARMVPLEFDKVLTLVRDITERKQVEEERSVRKIAAAVPHLMLVYDTHEQRYIYINNQVDRDLGYTPEEFLSFGADFPITLLHPDDRHRFLELVARFDTARDGEVFETEIRMKKANGEWRWFLGRVTIFTRTPNGHVHQIIGTAQDITEQKQAQQQMMAALKEKEALLKEVHHRVKNNLQIISSLLNLQAAQIKEPAVLGIFTETKNRVRSMALLHETLYRTENLARIDFPRYVDSLCAYLFRSYGVDMSRIELHTAIAAVTLDLDRAIPCGLIINELVSNAVKYAFPNQRTGRVTVELQELPQQRYQLSVCDNGIGLPQNLDYANLESLGLRLVYDLTMQLQGSIHVEHQGGAAFTLIFGNEPLTYKV